MHNNTILKDPDIQQSAWQAWDEAEINPNHLLIIFSVNFDLKEFSKLYSFKCEKVEMIIVKTFDV